jgi:hypothetical protein
MLNHFTHKKVIQDKMHICIKENLLYSSTNVVEASCSPKKPKSVQCLTFSHNFLLFSTNLICRYCKVGTVNYSYMYLSFLLI